MYIDPRPMARELVEVVVEVVVGEEEEEEEEEGEEEEANFSYRMLRGNAAGIPLDAGFRVLVAVRCVPNSFDRLLLASLVCFN